MADETHTNADSLSDTARQDGNGSPRRGLLDWMLVLVALVSAVWACLPQNVTEDRPFRRAVLLDQSVCDSNDTWYVDQRNRICWAEGTSDGVTGLAWRTESVPSQVRVLAHSDSLVEPLVRTITLLRQAGAVNVQVAITDVNPFPTDERPADEAEGDSGGE